MALTKKIECSACKKFYWADMKRSAQIEVELKKDPDYLNKYICRACKRNPNGVIAKPKTVDAKDGKKPAKTQGIKPSEVSATVKEYIPTTSEKYIHRFFGKVKDTDILKFHYDSTNPMMKNVLLVGETGTGKSLMVRHFCYINKLPYYRCSMSGDATSENIIGQMVMDEDGKFKFHYQILIKFMQEGGVFVMDEINAGDKEILFVLNSITDWERTATITQHKGEVVKASNKFLFVACMNPPEEYDINELNKALKSRFVPYYFDYDDKVDRQVLGSKEAKLLDFAKKVREARTAKHEIETPLSTRDLVQFKLVRDKLGYPLAKEMMINKFKNGEKQVIKTMLETCLEKSTVLKKKKDAQKGDANATQQP